MLNRSRIAASPTRLGAALVSLVLAATFCALLAAPAQAAPPTGDFGWSPATPLTGQQVVFTASFSDPDGPVTYAWDLNNDGDFSDDAGPTAVRQPYAKAGDFAVWLRISDGVEEPVTFFKAITVLNRAPAASIAAIPSNPVAGQEMTFVSTSTDPDGSIAGQAWDVNGDGTYDDGSAVYATRTFASPGQYPVRLLVTDDNGASSVAEVLVVVGVAGGPGGQVIGASARLMSPFPVVRMAGLVRRSGIRLRLLTVNAPIGATVSFRCRGRGCPFKNRTRTVKPPKAGTKGTAAAGEVRIRRFKRGLVRAGATLSIYVSKPGSIGKHTRFRIRRGRAPARRDRCLSPTGTTPIPCPA